MCEPTNRLPVWLALIAVAGGLLALSSTRASAASTPEAVDAAIKRAVAGIYSVKNGSTWEVTPTRQTTGDPGQVWSEAGGQWGGRTALAAYALIAAGEDPEDPKLAPAIKWLKTADIVGVYALGVRCQVWLLLPETPETRSLAREDYRRLMAGLLTHGKGIGLYSYSASKPDFTAIDHSVAQFGVLGVWACAQLGIEVSDRYWSGIEKRWIADQAGDGGWYYGGAAESGNALHESTQVSMTAAGVATLFITQDYTHLRDGALCRGNLKELHIDAGLKYIAGHVAQWVRPTRTSVIPTPGWAATRFTASSASASPAG